MHGDGIKLAITTHNPPAARVLDVTRLTRRAGRRMTGIDRVEWAYLTHLAGLPVPLFALARTAFGHVLVPARDAIEVLGAETLPEPGGLLARLSWRLPQERRATEAALRARAIGRAREGGLGRMLARRLPGGYAYLNVGHTPLPRSLFGRPEARIAVMLHDTIPLDLPALQRAGAPARFRQLLDETAARAHLVLYNSEATRRDVARHLGQGLRGAECVAHLGVERLVPGAWPLPAGPRDLGPYFMVLGTIEPRKNHALLLDLWERMAADPPASGLPRLLICGARGWGNAGVFARLDAGVPGVTELPGLDDGAIAALMRHSAGLLFPSLAEGFGLPPAEAVLMGLPVIAAPLPAVRETLGDIPIYASAADGYLWQNAIIDLAEHAAARPPAHEGQQAELPALTWDKHFKTVLTLT